jgi:hypothetical protein
MSSGFIVDLLIFFCIDWTQKIRCRCNGGAWNVPATHRSVYCMRMSESTRVNVDSGGFGYDRNEENGLESQFRIVDMFYLFDVMIMA